MTFKASSQNSDSEKSFRETHTLTQTWTRFNRRVGRSTTACCLPANMNPNLFLVWLVFPRRTHSNNFYFLHGLRLWNNTLFLQSVWVPAAPGPRLVEAERGPLVTETVYLNANCLKFMGIPQKYWLCRQNIWSVRLLQRSWFGELSVVNNDAYCCCRKSEKCWSMRNKSASRRSSSFCTIQLLLLSF